MDTWLDSEKEKLILENRKLVYYWVKKLGKTQANSDYEELISVGNVGLIKAANTYDNSKNIKFATYASRCINNEIFMYFRKENKHRYNISLDAPIANDGEGNELVLADLIPSKDSEFLEGFEDKEDFMNLMIIILNLLKPRERMIMLYKIAGFTQREIGKKLEISQSYVTRLEGRIRNMIRDYCNKEQQSKEVFTMKALDDNLYEIRFSSKDIMQFNKIFATLLKKLTSIEKIPDFKVSCNKERIVIRISSSPESFAFIAQIMQVIDDFEFEFTNYRIAVAESEETKVTAKNARESISNTEGICENAKADDKTTDMEATEKSANTFEKVREYILNKKSFTLKELQKQFPDLKYQNIASAVYSAKTKGIVIPVGRGEYVVNN